MQRTARVISAFAFLFAACSVGEQGAAGSGTPAPDGILVQSKSLAVHEKPGAISTFDVNGDGHLDLIVGGPAVSVLLGDGSLGFDSAPGTPHTGFVDATDFGYGDFDGDGRIDIAFAEHDAPVPRFWVLRGTENGGFEPSPRAPFVVDATPHLHTLAVDDFDGDGALDVVTDSWPESRLLFVAGQGDGSFKTPGVSFAVPEAPLLNLRSADMNGDGFGDIVTPAHDLGSVTVLLGDGQGTFAQVQGSPFKSFGGFSTLELGDVNRDGFVDVIEVHRSDQSTQYKTDALSILLNDGTGALSHAVGSPIFGLPKRSHQLAVGDLDGDGWLDVVTLGESNSDIAAFFGSPEGISLAGIDPAVHRPRGVCLGDFDGDGKSEVVVSARDGARVVFMNSRRSPGD